MHKNECNSCGGRLLPYGNDFKCQSCGSIWINEPEEPDGKAIDLANAWLALRQLDFDEAAEQFEDIISRYPKSYEAYWGLALAKYRIQYAILTNENKKVPTCNNISESSFLGLESVKKAIELAPPSVAEENRRQAEYIESVRKAWIEKANKEEPYDVFISFKASDAENGIEITQDSNDAMMIYHLLTKQGYNVFFSRLSLADKQGEMYEPYIYNALRTAKVMIVFGSKTEYFNAVWVKNEWTRFLTMIADGKKSDGALIPVYKSIKPEDLPVLLSKRQGMDFSHPLFSSELLESVKRIIGEYKQETTLDRIEIKGGQMGKKATSISQNQVRTREIGSGASAKTDITHQQTISLIYNFLRMEDWAEALDSAKMVLETDPNCAEALWAELLANSKLKDDSAFARKLGAASKIVDIKKIEKILSVSSKEFAERILDLLYCVDYKYDDVYATVLKTVLPYAYPKRDRQIKNAFDNVIEKGFEKSFDELVKTLDSTDVDLYISYVQKFADSTGDSSKKIKYLSKIIDLDESNVSALRSILDLKLKMDNPSSDIIPVMESILSYTDNGNREIERVLDIITNILPRLSSNILDVARQIVRYYSGDMSPLKDRFIDLAQRLLNSSNTTEAVYYYRQALSLDEYCADAYWGMCLAQIGAKNDGDIINCRKLIKDCPEFKKYLTMVDSQRQTECIGLSKCQLEKIAADGDAIKASIENKQATLKELRGKNTWLMDEKNSVIEKPKGYKQALVVKSSVFIFLAIFALMVILEMVYPGGLDGVTNPIAIVLMGIGLFASVICYVGVGISLIQARLKDDWGFFGGVIAYFGTVVTIGVWGLVLSFKITKKVSQDKMNARVIRNEKIRENEIEIQRLEKEISELRKSLVESTL